MVRPNGLFTARRRGGCDGRACRRPDARCATWLIAAGRGRRRCYLLTDALSPFDNLQLATMAYYFVAVAGLTVLTGLNGQISLGHGALMAVGAYTTAKLLGDAGTAGRSPPCCCAAALVDRGRRGRSSARRPRGCAGRTWPARRSRSRSGCRRSRRTLPGLPRRRERAHVVAADAAGVARRDVPARALAGVDRLPGRAASPTCCWPTSCAAASGARSAPCATTRSPPQLAGLPRRAHAGARLRRQRGLRRAGRRAARRRHRAGRARRVPARAVARAAHRRVLGGLGQPRRRGLGRGRAGARPDLGRRRQQGAVAVAPTSRPTSRSPSTASC